jgi:mannose-6-phosphate isomerase-like protein (cupin superfamily)
MESRRGRPTKNPIVPDIDNQRDNVFIEFEVKRGERLTMDILNHNDQPLERWREGVMTRMRMSILAGGRQLCIFDQFCDSGLGAPIHLHAVEEVLEVIEGTAEIQLGKESAVMTANQSVLIPAGVKHGFRNLEKATLHVRATLAASIFEATYDTDGISRHWVPD